MSSSVHAGPEPQTEALSPSSRWPMCWQDWLCIVLLTAFIGANCVMRSHGRLFWADELYGARVLDSPTWASTLRGWYEGADGGGLFFYLFGRLWVTLFGHTELALRLFSSAGMAVALALTWMALRRRFSTLVVAVAIGVVFFTPPSMLWQQLNGRFYVLFLAAAAFANLLFLITPEDDDLTPLTLALTACAHALLIGSHILGLVYSFSLIVAMLALDLTRLRLRPKLYLAAAAGWIMVPVSLHAIRASASIATTRFWTVKPSLALLPFGAILFAKPLLYTTALIALLTPALLLLRRRTRPSPALPRPELFLVAASLTALVILFAKSQVGIAIYSDRYLMPLSLADTVLLACWLAWALPASLTRNKPALTSSVLTALVLIACCSYAATRRVNYKLYPDRSYPYSIAHAIPPGTPVIGTTSPFTLLSRYDPTHTYLFMTDWPFDSDPKRFGVDYSGERLMENWARAGYESDHILPCPVLFTRYQDVYLLLDFHRGDWFGDKLLHNPDFQLQRIGHVDDWWSVDIWSVHRIRQGPPPC